MLTGKRVFDGDDVSDTLAAVPRAEPDWSLLRADVPPGLRTVIQGCLEKDRVWRVADISSLKFVLSEPVFVGSANDSAPHRFPRGCDQLEVFNAAKEIAVAEKKKRST
jgi:hypothetical protein